MDEIRYDKLDSEGQYTLTATNKLIYRYSSQINDKGWRMPPPPEPEPASEGTHVIFIEADKLDCGICDVRLKLCTEETPLPHEIANLFFFFECHHVDPMDNEPVVGSTGIAAMGQINHLGDRLHSYFFGDYILKKKGPPLKSTLFRDNYVMDFMDNPHSLFTDDIYASFSPDEIAFGGTALEGVPTDWLDDEHFMCSYYMGDEEFDPSAPGEAVLNNIELVSFFECFNQDDLKAYM